MYNKDCKIDELISIKDACYIDVRSPSEWLDGHIPNSINLPLFSDDEHAKIGTTYKQQGRKEATFLGMEIIAPKLAAYCKSISTIADSKTVVLYCWRGGMRSKAVHDILAVIGVPTLRLLGGYRSYRKHVVQSLNEVKCKIDDALFVVLHGMTGTGKTDILRHLQAESYPVIDLELMASHRGSVFGRIGLSGIHKQKQFDAELLQRLLEIGQTRYYVIEAESKRIGNVVIPDFILDGKLKGMAIYLDASISNRVNRIYNDYCADLSYQDIIVEVTNKLPTIAKKIDKNCLDNINSLLDANDIKELISVLIKDYYDPQYNNKRDSYNSYFIKVPSDDIQIAIAKIKDIIQSKMSQM